MPTFTADQIIDKYLIAKKTVPVYNLPPYDNLAKQIAIVKPGETVGLVYSYVGGTPGKFLVWQFYDKNNKAYYAAHVRGYYDVKALKSQGALTSEEKQEKEESANMSTGDKLVQYLKKSGNVLLYGGLALVALNVFLKNRK